MLLTYRHGIDLHLARLTQVCREQSVRCAADRHLQSVAFEWSLPSSLYNLISRQRRYPPLVQTRKKLSHAHWFYLTGMRISGH